MYNTLLKDKIKVRLEKDKIKTNILSLIISELQRKQKTDDDSVIKVIKDIIKSNSIIINHNADSQLGKKASLENEFIESYLPEKMDYDTLHKFVEHFIDINVQAGTSLNMSLMGKLMKALKSTGLDYDGKQAASIFKSFTGA